MKQTIVFLLSLLFFSFISCNNSDSGNADQPQSSVPVSTPGIVSTMPHDTSRFTEGLEFFDSLLIESTGNRGKSKLVLYHPSTGEIVKEVKLEDKYFGEGVTVFNDTIYQLTYQQKTVLLYDAKTFKRIKELPFEVGEGWGLTNDGKNLIASTGSSNLYFFEPGTFKLLKTLNVTENGSPVPNINELEYVDGFIYANQWQYSYIIKIDPFSGNVISKLDFSGLTGSVKNNEKHAQEFNGIAYNKKTKKFYVTGKHWSQIYEVSF